MNPLDLIFFFFFFNVLPPRKRPVRFKVGREPNWPGWSEVNVFS